MKITHLHPASHGGLPVVLGDDGEVVPYERGEALQAVLDSLGWDREDLSALWGYGNPASINRFFLSRPIPVPAHLMLLLDIELRKIQP